MTDSRLTLRFPPKLRSRLKKRAKSLGQTESEFVRSTVEKALQGERSNPSCLEILQKHTRFIGSAKGLPPDASTNEVYMEGFGADTE